MADDQDVLPGMPEPEVDLFAPCVEEGGECTVHGMDLPNGTRLRTTWPCRSRMTGPGWTEPGVQLSVEGDTTHLVHRPSNWADYQGEEVGADKIKARLHEYRSMAALLSEEGLADFVEVHVQVTLRTGVEHFTVTAESLKEAAKVRRDGALHGG